MPVWNYQCVIGTIDGGTVDGCVWCTGCLFSIWEASWYRRLKSQWQQVVAGVMGCGLLWMNTPHGSVCHQYFQNHPERRIQFLPVGQGDAILIQWKDGVVWLVDGGSFIWFGSIFERRGIWRIDKVWLHPHADHMDDLFAVLEQLEGWSIIVGRVLELEDEGGRYSALWDLARSKHVQKATHRSTGSRNSRSRRSHTPSTRLESGHLIAAMKKVSSWKSALIIRKYCSPEILKKTQSDIYWTRYRCDLLKVAHHGSRSSTSRDLITLLKPEWSVISVGEYSRFYHPHPETLWFLRNSTVLRTDWHGLIQVDFNAGSMHIGEWHLLINTNLLR